MENQNEALPQDLQTEILLRMPVKSLGKCICVSRKWAALIREKHFRDLYFLQSMKRPRLLFLIVRENDPNVLLHSVYQEKEPLLSSGQQQALITLEPDAKGCAVTGGLVCISSLYKIRLCNPATKKFLTLPELRERYQDSEVAFGRTYLGYDEATDVFKVLCVTNKRFDNRRDYRVFTVGSGENCWRTIVHESEHTPVTEGICKDGILYFAALSRSYHDPFMISFNLRSEELKVIELPDLIDISMFGRSLVNYNGEFALVKQLVDENGEIKIWVSNEVAGDWREKRIVIPRWRETVGDLCKDFCFKGTIGTGELVFAVDLEYFEGSMIVLYFDIITHHLRKFEIDGVANDCYVDTLLDHVDSLLLM